MPTFPTIAANTPFNDATTLDAIVSALDERWRAAGSPGTGPRSVWFTVPIDAGETVTGTYGVDQEVVGQMGPDGTAGPYSGRLVPRASCPVRPGTVTIEERDENGDVVQTLSDDGAGNLTDGADGEGHFSYATGIALFTFTDPVPADHSFATVFESAWTALEFSSPPYGPLGSEGFIGRRITITGKGEFTLIGNRPDAPYLYCVSGDSTCSGRTYEINSAGNVLDAAFWATLQNCALAVIPCYLNSYAYPSGFVGSDYNFNFEGPDPNPIWFVANSPDFINASGLDVFPRRVRARGPCSFTYDPETDTTTVVDLTTTEENAPDFAAAHVGMRLDVFGVGQFIIDSFVDETTVVIAGRVERSNTVVSVLPDDPMDQDDPAFGCGVCQVGDVQGPWLLYDLLAAMKPLEWTKAAGRLGGGAGDNCRSGVGTSTESLAAAEADAETAFGATVTTMDAGPSAEASVAEGIGTWTASITRTKSQGYWSVPGDSAPLTFDVDFYSAGATPAGGTFDGNGDFAEADTVVLCLSESNVADRSGLTAAWFGSLDVPAWPTSGVFGYESTGSLVVAKWHFTHAA